MGKKVLKEIVIGAALFALGAGVGTLAKAASWGAKAVKVATSVASALKVMGVMKALNGIAAQLAGRSTPRATFTGEYDGTVEPRRIIYGKVLVGGMNVIPMVTTGTDNRYLHQVLAIAGHTVYAMDDVYFNQEVISSGSITAVTGTANDGKVTSGTYANKVWLRRNLGSTTQTADYILTTDLSSYWTSNHRGRGVANLMAKFDYDEKVWKQGKPELSVIVRGKICYDPRLDSSPGADPTNPSYAAYTTNPALCLADYLTDTTLGLGETTSRIDWAMVETAADICDENVTVPDGLGGSTTQKRYTCNTALWATTEYEENISVLAGAMLGTCLYSGGKWRMRAGAWESASFSLGDDDILRADIVTAFPYKDRYNGIRGTYTDPNNNYQYNEFPATQNASYVTADGESVFKDVRLEACANVYEAQRAAVILVRKSRNRTAATLVCGMSAWKIRPGEVGIITHSELGWSNQYVRCESWKFNPEGTVELFVRVENSADWTDPAVGDYLQPLSISNVTPVYYIPSAPANLTAIGNERGISFSWTAPTVVPSNAVYELYEHTSSTPFASATKVWEGITTSAFIGKTDITTRYYWVRIRTSDGTYGTEYPTSTAGVAGTAVGQNLTGSLTKPAVTLAADSSGTVSSFTPASGDFKVYLGATDISTGNGVTYAKTSESGCTASINASTGAYSVSAMSTDTATATFTATYGGTVITCILVLSKAKAGTNGSNGSNGTNGTDAANALLTNEAATVVFYSDGTTYPSGAFDYTEGYAKVYVGGADVTSSATFSASGTNVTGTVNTADNTPVAGKVKGYYRVTAMSADSGYLTISITYNSVTYTRLFSVSKAKGGYEALSSLPSTNLFTGRIVYNTTDKKLYRYDGTKWVTDFDAAAYSGDSAVLNHSFEDVDESDNTLPKGWRRSCVWGGTSTTSKRITSDSVSGNACLALIPGSGNSADMGGPGVPLAAGETWYFAFWAKAVGTNAGTSPGFYGRIRGGTTSTDMSTYELYIGVENAVVPTSWTKYEGVVTIPSGMIWGAPIFLNYLTNTGVEIRVDDVVFVKQITANRIKANTITANQIAAGTITSTELASNSVTAAKITAGVITASKFQTDAGVDLASIVPGALNTIISASNLSPTTVTSVTGSPPYNKPAETTGIACNGQLVSIRTRFLVKSAADGGGGGNTYDVFATIYYSTDNGSTWNTYGGSYIEIFDSNTTYGSEVVHPTGQVAPIMLPLSGTFKAKVEFYQQGGSPYPYNSHPVVDDVYIEALVVFQK